MASEDEEDTLADIFQEPNGYFQPKEPPRFIEHILLSGKTLRLRLVGFNPLWVFNPAAFDGQYLWNGAQVLSTYLQNHTPRLVRGKNVLELGAGAGLPSLVAAMNGASQVVVTDYPDEELIENLCHNIEHVSTLSKQRRNIVAEGYLWGADTKALLKHVPEQLKGFDVLVLADLLFNHHCHDALVDTILLTLTHTPGARALVFFTPYRPWLLQKDLAFFELCEKRGLVVEKVLEEVMEKVMFEKDEGDQLLRRTVFGYEVRWPDH